MENIILKTSGFTKEDIQQVVEIHRNEINKGFLSSLGNRPLELVYSHISQSKLCILILAINPEKNDVSGFILGTLNTGSLYKEFLRKRPLQALIYIAPKLISFSKLRKAWESLFYPRKKEFLKMPKAELLVLAVRKEYESSGFARNLFEKLIECFRESGVNEFRIATGNELIRAQKFYEKMGAVKVNDMEIHKGHRSWIYRYQIS